MNLPQGAAARQEWRQQKRSAWLYRALAQTDRHRAPLFRALADAADRQAAVVDPDAPGARGRDEAGFHPPLRARVVAALARRLGVERTRPLLTALNLRGLANLRQH